MEEFYSKVIARDGLPSDFGGTLASVSELHEQFKTEYYNLREYFIAEEAQRWTYWNQQGVHKKSKKGLVEGDKPKAELIQSFQKLEID